MVKASLLIIGDEILSGRTQDKNLGYLATWLNEAGIQLAEVRVVPDIEGEIVDAVNSLRAKYDYVFTTGGIGPTHDDITSSSVAMAFGLKHTIHPEAFRRLEAHYKENDFTDARQRMAYTPEGAELVDNPVSIAPGFQVENVFVLAGVPKIMQAMLEQLRPRLKGGKKILSKTLIVFAPESEVAETLEEIETNRAGTGVGSYPFFREGLVGTEIVVRSEDEAQIDLAIEDLQAFCEKQGVKTKSKA